MKTHRAGLNFFTLSPVHIGCNRDYEPTDYVENITADGQQEIIAFDAAHLIDALTAAEKVQLSTAAITLNPLIPVKQIINRAKDRIAQQTGVRHIPKLTRNLINLANNQAPQIRRIERTAFDPLSELAILPGSSIKGAIRTAWINSHQNLLQVDIPHDPLRLLAVPDAFATSEMRAISFLQRPHKGPLPNVRPGTPSSVRYDFLLELIQKKGKFQNEINLQVQNNADVTTPINSLQLLIQATNNYYLPQLHRTIEYLQGMKDFRYGESWLKYIQTNIINKSGHKVTGDLKSIRTFGGKIEDGDAMLLRIGKHCGAESLTLEPPNIKRIRTRYGEQHATHTMTVTYNDRDHPEECEPFGWVFVEVNAIV